MKGGKIMGWKNFINEFKMDESAKERYLNIILDKIKDGKEPTEREKRFLDNYENSKDKWISDYMMMDKQMTFEKITDILDRGKKIVCNLNDRDGKIGLEIDTITNDYSIGETIMTMKNGEEHQLKDNYLYNILYVFKTDEFSLEAHDEYFEKIPVHNDDNF